MFLKLKSPIIVQWEVTYDCNKNCVHCYNYWRNEKSPIKEKATFYYEEAEKITNDIIENDVFQVVITGGEPFLVFDELYPFLKKLKSNNIEVSINTNLSCFNQFMADKLKEIGIKYLLVSVPASNADTDYKITNNKSAFENTISGLKLAIANNFKVSANMVVSQLNLENIFENAKMLNELGVKRFSVTRAVKPSNCNNFEKYRLSYEEFCQLPIALKEIKEKLNMDVFSVEAYPICFNEKFELLKETGFVRGCTAGKTFCAIDPKGNVRPCILINDNRGNNIKEAWESLDDYRDDSMFPEECKGCKYANMCGGRM